MKNWEGRNTLTLPYTFYKELKSIQAEENKYLKEFDVIPRLPSGLLIQMFWFLLLLIFSEILVQNVSAGENPELTAYCGHTKLSIQCPQEKKRN